MSWLLSDPNRQYIKEKDTTPRSIMETWKRFGFVPPEETRLLKEKQENDRKNVHQVQSEKTT